MHAGTGLRASQSSSTLFALVCVLSCLFIVQKGRGPLSPSFSQLRSFGKATTIATSYFQRATYGRRPLSFLGKPARRGLQLSSSKESSLFRLPDTDSLNAPNLLDQYCSTCPSHMHIYFTSGTTTEGAAGQAAKNRWVGRTWGTPIYRLAATSGSQVSRTLVNICDRSGWAAFLPIVLSICPSHLCFFLPLYHPWPYPLLLPFRAFTACLRCTDFISSSLYTCPPHCTCYAITYHNFYTTYSLQSPSVSRPWTPSQTESSTVSASLLFRARRKIPAYPLTVKKAEPMLSTLTRCTGHSARETVEWTPRNQPKRPCMRTSVPRLLPLFSPASTLVSSRTVRRAGG